MARNERILGKYGTCRVSPAVDYWEERLFAGHERPDIRVQEYLERIFRHANIAPPVYVVAYIYIDCLCQFHPGFIISSSNVRRLLITTIMEASKFVEDLNYRNCYFAKVGGMRTKELNNLEVDFLFLMGFKLQVSVFMFESYCCHLETEVSAGGGYQIEWTLRLMYSKEEPNGKVGGLERGVEYHFMRVTH